MSTSQFPSVQINTQYPNGKKNYPKQTEREELKRLVGSRVQRGDGHRPKNKARTRTRGGGDSKGASEAKTRESVSQTP